jgi:hypothetical protein
LPLETRGDDGDRGLAFYFLADADNTRTPKVITGHDDGLITIALAEADDVERERRRTTMREPYRTLLGHFRHEVGHYYWDRLVECLIRDRNALLAFYDFPAEHWKHLRTSNVIESSFATVRHRTVRSKGCLSNKTALAMIFKLAEAAEKSWRRLDGYNQLPKVSWV